MQNANVKNNKAVKRVKTAKIEKINLSQFADKLKDVKEVVKNEKQHLYIYPENFTKADISDKQKGGKFRQNKRNILKRFCDNIFVYAKIKDIAKLQNEIKAFKAFYKEFYRINDLSVRSVTNSKDNEANVSVMLQIIKEVEKH